MSSVPCDHETEDAMPVLRKRQGGGSSHIPIRAEQSTPHSHALPPSRNETVRPQDKARSRPLRQRPLNRETLSDRLTPPTAPQRTTNHPEQSVERSKRDGETNPEDGDTRIDDEPLHHEADRARASMTTTRKPAPGPHATRVVERAGERDAIVESHFQSNLSHRTS